MSISDAIDSMPLHLPSVRADLPNTWSWSRLDELCLGIFDCPHSTPKLTVAGPYVVRTQDIGTGVFRAEDAAHVSEDTYSDRTSRAVPSVGDLLYSREGTYFGVAAEVPANTPLCLGQRMVLIRPDERKVSVRYLRFWLNSPVMAAYIEGYRDGSVAQRLNLPTIRALPVLVPPIAEQRGISAVLGSLDDKFEVNLRVADSTRKLAIAYAADRLSRCNGPWRTLEDIVTVTKGVSYRSADLVPGDGWLVSLKCAARDGSFHRDGLKPFSGPAKDAQVVDEGDIVVAQTDITQRAEVIGRPIRVERLGFVGKLVASLDFVIVRPGRELTREVLFVLLNQQEFRDHVLGYCNGTTVLHMNSRAVPSYQFSLPDADVVKTVTSVIKPLLERSDCARRENAALTRLRDALLPRLLSGDLCVRDAESLVEEVV